MNNTIAVLHEKLYFQNSLKCVPNIISITITTFYFLHNYIYHEMIRINRFYDEVIKYFLNIFIS